jgi:hypothetical protein
MDTVQPHEVENGPPVDHKPSEKELPSPSSKTPVHKIVFPNTPQSDPRKPGTELADIDTDELFADDFDVAASTVETTSALVHTTEATVSLEADELFAEDFTVRPAEPTIPDSFTEVGTFGVMIVGMQYYANSLSAISLNDHDELLLVREPLNPYDGNAVRVDHKASGKKLGHASRELAAKLAPLMDGNIVHLRASLDKAQDTGMVDPLVRDSLRSKNLSPAKKNLWMKIVVYAEAPNHDWVLRDLPIGRTIAFRSFA